MMASGLAKLAQDQRARALVLVSLLITWWFAHMVPHFEPIISSSLEGARQKLPMIKLDWAQPMQPSPLLRYDSAKLALLIEARPFPELVPQILHMIMTVPSDWRFLFIGSAASVVSVERAHAIKHQQSIGKIGLMVLPPPWSIESKEMVFRLLTDMRFYDEYLPGIEWILKFESDSVLCSNAETSLNDWLQWDWTGAPRLPDDRFAGNGGLTLRRMPIIRKVLQSNMRQNDTQPEDEWFGNLIWDMPGAKVASGIENALSVENIYVERPMGYHITERGKGMKDDLWADEKRRTEMLNYCPELSLIMDMKLKMEKC